jgi:tight adherence protein C
MSPVPFAAALAALGSVLAVAAAATVTSRPILARLAPPTGMPTVGGLRAVLRAVGRSRLGRQVGREQVEVRLAASRGTWTADEVAGAKVGGPVAVLALAATAPAPLPLLALPGAVVAFRLPELVLARRARSWRRVASSEVPLFLDLLTVATSAGLAPQVAVRLAAEPVRGPLGDELRAALGKVDLGRRWRDELQAAAERLALPDLRRAVALLRRTETLGASAADEMARLAADVRAERRSRAAERARTAPVKMLFPLVFLILPAFLLLTVVPVLLTTVQSIG